MDYRHLFQRVVTRKPIDWTEVHEPKPEFFTPEKIEALRDLPKVHVEPHVGTFDDIFVREQGIEYILVREYDWKTSDIEVFYVNTEGYSYARYALSLPMDVWDKLGL